uniref:Ras-associating domain-containing protein n=1 Tax=Macrostomum lignano TaxID=282301 RepID=A0A1I8FNM5_9PLAT
KLRAHYRKQQCLYCSVSGSRKLIIICKSYLSELMDSGSEYGDFSDYEDEGDGLPNGLAMHSMVTEPERGTSTAVSRKRVLPVCAASEQSQNLLLQSLAACMPPKRPPQPPSPTSPTPARTLCLGQPDCRSAGQWTVARRRLELTPTECCASRTSNSLGLGQNAKYIPAGLPEIQGPTCSGAHRRSVTGGAKKMRPMSDKIIKKLRQGIINIATKTNVDRDWRFFNLGTKQACRRSDSRLPTGWRSERDVVLIGVCPWGSVRDKECLLVTRTRARRCWSRTTPTSCCATTGTESMFGAPRSTSGPASRRKLLRQMVRRRSPRRRQRPALRDAVRAPHHRGRPRKDVQAALVSVETGSPVVVVKGSGRAANVIAYICENTELERYEIEAITEEHFSSEFEPNSSEMRSLVDWLMKLAEPDYQRMLNVYDAESMDPNEQLDRVILTTFLRQTSLSVVTQLNMAMPGTGPDPGPRRKFSRQKRKAKWGAADWPRPLEYSMLRALARNRRSSCLFCSTTESTSGHPAELETLAGLYSSHSRYATHKREPDGYQERLLRAVGLYVSAKSGGVLRSPYPRRDRSSYQAEDLLIWSITSDTIASALVSAMMLRNMKSLAESEGSLEASAQLGAAARQFRRLAAGVLATCYARRTSRKRWTLWSAGCQSGTARPC